MSIFELIMLISFGLSWPFSIHKSYTSRQTAGKSEIFLIALLIGYVSGIIHKYMYSMDYVLIAYVVNLLLVSVDLALFYRNKKLERCARETV